MRRFLRPMLVLFVTLVALAASLSLAYAQDPEDSVAAPTGGASASARNASCIQPDPAQNVCYLNLSEMTYSDPGNFTGLEIDLAVGLTGEDPENYPVVASYQGYEENLFVPYDRNGLGFQVPCGEANPPDGKKGFDYTLRASFSGGSGGGIESVRVVCPAYVPGVPTAVGTNSFTATLDRLSRHQATFVALAVTTGLLTNLLVPAGLRRWHKRTE